MSGRRLLFFSPDNNAMEDNPVTPDQSLVFSPMDGVETRIKPTNIETTPCRKLSMESVQSPLDNCSDYGYGNSVTGSCSSLDSSNGGDPGPTLPSSSEDQQSVNRFPLSDIGLYANGRKTLLARRSMKTFPFICQDKENLSPKDSSPSSPSSSGQKSFVRQISSPLEQMCLKSPIFHVGQHNSRSSSTASVSESDGYYSEVFDAEEWEADPSLSYAMTSLINDPINEPPTPMTSAFSNQNEVACPTPVHPGDSSGCSRKGSLKRSSPHNEIVQRKRPPLPFDSNSQDSPLSSKPPLFPRSQSLCTPSSDISPTLFSPGSESLIGDTSKPYALPLTKGSCQDLRCISPETVCDLLNGKYSDVIDKYNIIDCRFPYEYEGGHIRGAKNIWMQEQLLETLFSGPLEHPGDQCREIFIFHCEFSSQRGPKMCRFLRETDRKRNAYPNLYYPELYLVNGGYKAFSASYLGMCEPQGYRPMEDELFREQLRICKIRSKSWSGKCSARRRPSLVH